jgi:FtsP/CotA-like multicopper oxidase with cupredoxin domain
MTQALIDRRSVLAGCAGVLAAASWPFAERRALASVREFNLIAAPARLSLVGTQHPPSEVWCYDQMIPGPEIRVR